MISRNWHIERLLGLLDHNPVVAILGARQVGKTTLATDLTKYLAESYHFFDLENPLDLARLSDPLLTLSPLKGLVVIDEVQRKADLFPVIRVLADRQSLPAKFLLLGSATPNLLRQSNETLAGRIAYHTLHGFSTSEVGVNYRDRLWLRGGFPRSYMAGSDSVSWDWREEFIATFLERDIPQLGIQVASQTLRRFWTMLAHTHGRILNASLLARNFGVNHTTIRRYLDILSSTLVVRTLQPWYENLKKRQVKSPKVYFTDTGLLHTLLGITNFPALESHPMVGASWEGFAMGEILTQLRFRSHECFFWATHAGAELDLLFVRGEKRIGFEFKRSSSPGITKSMKVAMEDLHLNRLHVVHPNDQSFELATNIHATSLSHLTDVHTDWDL